MGFGFSFSSIGLCNLRTDVGEEDPVRGAVVRIVHLWVLAANPHDWEARLASTKSGVQVLGIPERSTERCPNLALSVGAASGSVMICPPLSTSSELLSTSSLYVWDLGEAHQVPKC